MTVEALRATILTRRGINISRVFEVKEPRGHLASWSLNPRWAGKAWGYRGTTERGPGWTRINS